GTDVEQLETAVGGIVAFGEAGVEVTFFQLIFRQLGTDGEAVVDDLVAGESDAGEFEAGAGDEAGAEQRVEAQLFAGEITVVAALVADGAEQAEAPVVAREQGVAEVAVVEEEALAVPGEVDDVVDVDRIAAD